jgi:hypothetical protein
MARKPIKWGMVAVNFILDFHIVMEDLWAEVWEKAIEKQHKDVADDNYLKGTKENI